MITQNILIHKSLLVSGRDPESPEFPSGWLTMIKNWIFLFSKLAILPLPHVKSQGIFLEFFKFYLDQLSCLNSI